MGLKRMTMELIKPEKSRLLTYKKRKANLLKKASEFSTLCGIEACVVVYPSKLMSDHQSADKSGESWPSNSNQVKSLIDRYRKTDRPKKCYNVSDYYLGKRQNESQREKLRRPQYTVRYTTWEKRLQKLTHDQLRKLLDHLGNRCKVAERRFDDLQHKESNRTGSVRPMMHGGSSSNHQVGQNVYCNVENYKSNNNSNVYQNPGNFQQQPVSNFKSLYCPLPNLFQPDHQLQSSVMASWNFNLFEENNDYGCPSNNLQVFDVAPLDVMEPFDFQSVQNPLTSSLNTNLVESSSNNYGPFSANLLRLNFREDAMMNLPADDLTYSNQFTDTPISINTPMMKLPADDLNYSSQFFDTPISSNTTQYMIGDGQSHQGSHISLQPLMSDNFPYVSQPMQITMLPHSRQFPASSLPYEMQYPSQSME